MKNNKLKNSNTDIIPAMSVYAIFAALTLLLTCGCSSKNENPLEYVLNSLNNRKAVTRASLMTSVDEKNAEITKKHGALVVPPDISYDIPMKEDDAAMEAAYPTIDPAAKKADPRKLNSPI